MTARLATVEELAQWIGAAQARGAVRIELWQKLRGVEPRRLVTAPDSADAWDVADDFMATIHQHRRSDQGAIASYAASAQGPEAARAERVFLVPPATSGAAVTSAASSPSPEAPAPLVAVSAVLGTVQHLTQTSFAALQKENEQQRRTNEALVRASTGYFETFANGYERTFADLQARLDGAVTQAATLRAKAEALEADNARLTRELEELRTLRIEEWSKASLAEKRQDFAMNKLTQLLPVLVHHVTKQPMTGGSPAGELGLEAFLDSVHPDQLQRLFGLLTTEQKILVGHLVEAHREKAAAKQGPGSVVTDVLTSGMRSAAAAHTREARPDPATRLAEQLKKAGASTEGPVVDNSLFEELHPSFIERLVDQYGAWIEAKAAAHEAAAAAAAAAPAPDPSPT